MNEGGVRVIARLLIYKTLVERGFYGAQRRKGAAKAKKAEARKAG